MERSRIAVYQSPMGKYGSDEMYIYVNIFITRAFGDKRLNREKAIFQTAKMADHRISLVMEDGFAASYTRGTIWAKNELFSELQRYAADHNMEIVFHNFYGNPLAED